MRISSNGVLVRSESKAPEQINGFLSAFIAADLLVGTNHFAYLINNPQHGIQSQDRLLRYQCDACSTNPAHTLLTRCEQVRALKNDRPAAYSGITWQKAKYRQ